MADKISRYLTAFNSLDSKFHVANMGPTWVLSSPVGPHVGPMNLAIRESFDVSSVIILNK